MGSTVELVRFTVSDGRTQEMLDARARMVDEFRTGREGFVDSRLISLPDGQWLDVIEWRTAADLDISRARGADLPGFAAFLATVATIVADERGELASA
jgi:hypothetical protein